MDQRLIDGTVSADFAGERIWRTTAAPLESSLLTGNNLKISVSLEQSCFIQLEFVLLFHISLSNQSV